jgi:hypothetical protein
MRTFTLDLASPSSPRAFSPAIRSRLTSITSSRLLMLHLRKHSRLLTPNSGHKPLPDRLPPIVLTRRINVPTGSKRIN